MPIPDDVDSEALISRLAGPLLPADRAAFRAAAEEALTRVPCLGEGAAYRAIAGLQRRFFDPRPTLATRTWVRATIARASSPRRHLSGPRIRGLPGALALSGRGDSGCALLVRLPPPAAS